jgi:hypothetical protein
MTEPLIRKIHVLLSCTIGVGRDCLYPIISMILCRYTQSSSHCDKLQHSLSVDISVTDCLFETQVTVAPFIISDHPLTLCRSLVPVWSVSTDTERVLCSRDPWTDLMVSTCPTFHNHHRSLMGRANSLRSWCTGSLLIETVGMIREIYILVK